MTDSGVPGRPRVPRDDLDPGLVARARRVIRARETRDRWAKYDVDAADAVDEATQIRRGGNRP